ncbi:hypothetical protein ONE63_000835 [Megalurothrips usitatus]|uniref:Uncharacterized protein n=1 Tax=Megalurothrips usitatus TaxID=439358 RepID=A0AAV7Y5N9_9NEOP|nr:hypothetical protein ONE63_000835 [Megalurothrips usitatus]
MSSDTADENEMETEEEEEEEEEIPQEEEVEGNQPLYEGAPLTLHQSLVAILTLAVAHNLTGTCIVDILQLILLHCPVTNVLKFHYYCTGCMFPLETKESVCRYCNGANEVAYFIELPVIAQLQTMLLRTGFYDLLQYRFLRIKKVAENIEDIYDGELYKEHSQEGGFLNNRNNISFMWYSDGVAIFRGSTNYSVWPIFLVINELSYKERTKKEHMILAGLWFGSKKPDPNVFLLPFHTFFQSFENEGHVFNLPNQTEVRMKGMVLCGTCDYQAKSMFMNFRAHNGYYGCARCYSRGTSIQTAGGAKRNGRVHVHPYEPNPRERKHDDIQECLRRTGETGKPCFGVLGPSILYRMVPDFIRSMAIDIMHGVFLGVCKLLMKLWFSSEYNQFEFSLNNLVQLVDARLKLIRPPSFVQRVPRSIEKHLKHWKASEYKLWMMYYSVPVLKGIMNEEYLDHYVKLVSAIFLLSKDSISLDDVLAAKTLLHSFVRDFARLYGIRFLGLNVHQLLHLPSIVLDLGPCWVYSCFFLEGMNGYLSKMYHGTRYVGLQISKSASYFLTLPVMVRDLELSPARTFCEKLISDVKCVKLNEQIPPASAHCFTVGQYFPLPLIPQSVQDALASLNVVGGQYQMFHRLRRKGIVYSAMTYTRGVRKLSAFVLSTINNVPKFCAVDYFIRRMNCECNNDPCNCKPEYYAIGTLFKSKRWFVHDIPGVRLSFMSSVTRSDETLAFRIESINCLCFYFEIGDDVYIGKPVNSLEVE